MRLEDFEQRTVQAAEIVNPELTLGQLVHVLDEEARAADFGLASGNNLAVLDACTHLILASALLIQRCGLSWTAALLDVQSATAQPDSLASGRKRRRESA